MKRAFVFSSGADTNGNGMRIKQGFDARSSDWHVDSLAMRQSWIGYPEHHGGPRSIRQAAAHRLYREADVVHLFNSLDGWQDFDQISGERLSKPILLHHHGTTFRSEPVATAAGAAAIGAVQVASTVDLTLLAPDVAWLPAIYDLDELAAIPHGDNHPGLIRIVHAPTNRHIKGTEEVIAAVERLRETVPLEFDLIEKAPWKQCLARIAQADIVIDQLTLGYGSLAVEAWGMGIPVVARVTDPSVRAEMVRRWKKLPFEEARPSLVDTLRRLATSSEARAEAAARGLAHARRYHDEPKVVARLEEIYDGLRPTRYPESKWRNWRPAAARV